MTQKKKQNPDLQWNTGAYEIICHANQKVYVGGAYKNFDERRELHWKSLKARELMRRLRGGGYDQSGGDAREIEVQSDDGKKRTIVERTLFD